MAPCPAAARLEDCAGRRSRRRTVYQQSSSSWRQAAPSMIRSRSMCGFPNRHARSANSYSPPGAARPARRGRRRAGAGKRARDSGARSCPARGAGCAAGRLRAGLCSVGRRQRHGRGGRRSWLEPVRREPGFFSHRPACHCACGDPGGDRLARTAGGGADRAGRLGGDPEPNRHGCGRIDFRRARCARGEGRRARPDRGREQPRPPVRLAGDRFRQGSIRLS